MKPKQGTGGVELVPFCWSSAGQLRKMNPCASEGKPSLPSNIVHAVWLSHQKALLTYFHSVNSGFFVSTRYDMKKRQSAHKSFLYLIQQYNPSFFFHSTYDAAKPPHMLQNSKWVSKNQNSCYRV